MKFRMVVVSGFFFLFTLLAGAQSVPLRVLSSNGIKGVVEELKAGAEREIGRPLAIEFNTSAAIRQRIQSGESFDVALLTSDVMDELVKSGKIAAATRVDLGRSGIGVGIRAGGPKPDIRTPEALRKTLLSAKSMTWVEAGASRVYIDKMLQDLGIASDVKSKTILTKVVSESITRVAEGKTELLLTLVSEITPAKDLQFVGPFPQDLQGYVTVTGAVSSNSKNAEAGIALIKLLKAPAAAPVYKSKGMEQSAKK